MRQAAGRETGTAGPTASADVPRVCVEFPEVVCAHVAKGRFGTVQLRRGRGAEGAVVAVKVIDRAAAAARFAHRVLAEKAALTALGGGECAQLVRLEFTDKDDRALYFVLEAVLGGPLHQHLPLSTVDARLCVAQVSAGLAFMHARGFAHRDVKASNVLVTATGAQFKLCDLGAAKLLRGSGGPGADHGAKAHSLVGTPHALAPEVVDPVRRRGEGYGFPVDVWALGILLFEVLTGAPPFRAGNSSSNGGEMQSAEDEGTRTIEGEDERENTELSPHLCAQICEAEVPFSDGVSSYAHSLIADLLLQRDPDARPELGADGGAFRTHAYFLAPDDGDVSQSDWTWDWAAVQRGEVPEPSSTLLQRAQAVSMRLLRGGQRNAEEAGEEQAKEDADDTQEDGDLLSEQEQMRFKGY